MFRAQAPEIHIDQFNIKLFLISILQNSQRHQGELQEASGAGDKDQGEPSRGKAWLQSMDLSESPNGVPLGSWGLPEITGGTEGRAPVS